MKTRKKADAVATIGTYKDKDGKECKRYSNVGVLFESEDGRLSLKLDTIPIGPGWSGFIQFFPPKQAQDQMPDGRTQQRSMPPKPPESPADEEQDDIPF